MLIYLILVKTPLALAKINKTKIFITIILTVVSIKSIFKYILFTYKTYSGIFSAIIENILNKCW